MENTGITSVYSDICYDLITPGDLRDGAWVSDLSQLEAGGVTPTAARILHAEGPGGGNPFVKLHFASEGEARRWHAIASDDASPGWFEEMATVGCCGGACER